MNGKKKRGDHSGGRKTQTPKQQRERANGEDACQIARNARDVLAELQSFRLGHSAPSVQHNAGDDTVKLVLRFLEEPKRLLPADGPEPD